jgi:uncharacterized protein (DUF1810 family)
MGDLDRFTQAQDGHAGFAQAIAELRAGRKTSHWIWYIFPQLAGLGRSPMATRFGLRGPEEAAAYLRDPVLTPRLLAAAAAARAHLAPAGARPAARVETLMGSHIDAVKLVSSMTLFARVARAAHAADPRPELAALADHADAILAATDAQGFKRCAFTEAALAAPPPGSPSRSG